jgi:hypothetical protein
MNGVPTDWHPLMTLRVFACELSRQFSDRMADAHEASEYAISA